MNPRVRFYATYLLPVTLVAGVIVALDQAGLDPLVSGWFFDVQSGGFPWRYNGFLEVVMHHWTKYLVILVAVAAFAGYLISFLAPQLTPLRALLLFVALALTNRPTRVTNGKQASANSRACWIVTLRGLLSKNTKPKASAPQCTALMTSSTRVIPQILIRVMWKL